MIHASRVSLLAVALFCASPSAVRAAEPAADGEALHLIGTGTRKATALRVSVYRGSLYASESTHDARVLLRSSGGGTVLLLLSFVRDVEREKAASAFAEGASSSVASPSPALERDVAAFGRWLPAFREGDALEVRWRRGVDTAITSTTAGQRRTFRGSSDLGHALFLMWIGPKPIDDGFKRGLLGGRP